LSIQDIPRLQALRDVSHVPVTWVEIPDKFHIVLPLLYHRKSFIV